ncbi:MAG: tRNA (5-methylaminomethyl-2-thiouridine)(34)-methyltransferase MnmD [Rhodoferax sp.]
MSPTPTRPAPLMAYEPVQWLADDSPRSTRFDDVYRSRAGALLQAQTVFLDGCQLGELWREQQQCTILETGFGLGINFLATWAAWQADPQRCQHLHFISIEAYPVAGEDIVRSAQTLQPPGTSAAAHQASVAALGQQLAGAWRGLHQGVQTLHFAHGQVQLTLAIGDVLPMLQQITASADAVYLDGFSPARNPQMWSPATLQAVAQRCHPGTRLASYSSAGAVRRGLTAVGFEVQRRPGLAPKWQRLEARYSLARRAGSDR